jgi:hypothetical protein
MGFHKTSATRNMRTTHAHLDRKENGDIYAIFKLDFTKDASRFEYCFIGANVGVLAYDGKVIDKHPKFRNIGAFEAWCRKYCAEHDL